MFNWFKKKTEKAPEITIWTDVPGMEEIFPPRPATEVIPDWYKKMPLDITDEFSGHPGTAKRCPAFVDYYSSGVVLKLWCDLYIKINEDRSYEVRAPERIFKFEGHLDNQFLDHIPDRETFSMVLKGVSPWRMATPDGWGLMQLPLTYNFDKRFTVLPGVIWTDIHHEINPQIAFHGYGEFMIPRGTPLAMYVPVRHQKANFTVRQIDAELKRKEERAYYWFASKFFGGYKEHQRITRNKK